TAGVVAALSAARNGANTILVERYGFLGGTMINGAGPLHSFYNLYKAFPGAEKIQVVRGLPSEIIDRLVAYGGSYGHLEQDQGGDYDSVITLIDREIFKEVILDMMIEAGVHILPYTMIADVIMDGNSVKGVIIEGKSGREAILTNVVVDTTGDADVAFKAGANCVKKHETTSVGMPFGMCNVDIKRLVAFLEENNLITQIVNVDKDIKADNVVRLGFDLKKIPVFKEFMDKDGMWGPLCITYHENECSYINSANLRAVDATDTEALSNAEIALRKQVMTLSRMLKQYIPGFEKAYVSWTPVGVGVRYTRVVECEHDMTLDEIINCARFDDEVMLYGFHDCAPRIMIKNAGYYGIPYRALLPKKIDGLLVAGRMITSDWAAHMSTRNTVSCMAQGEAVGAAAALCAKYDVNPRELDVQLLREALVDQGVFLG
ncbi:MAG: hypothetical protein PWQ93_902, partial [Clostridiales bacterium]|nr:hypothetical protein [Clostridiales bacterium]